MNLKVLCARLTWTVNMTPLIYIFTDQPPHFGGFPWSHSVAFLMCTLQMLGGLPTPVHGSARAAAEKRAFARCSGPAPVPMARATSRGAEMAVWGEEELCRERLLGSRGRNVFKIHG